MQSEKNIFLVNCNTDLCEDAVEMRHINLTDIHYYCSLTQLLTDQTQLHQILIRTTQVDVY